MNSYNFCDVVTVTDNLGSYPAVVLEQVADVLVLWALRDTGYVSVGDEVGFHLAFVPVEDLVIADPLNRCLGVDRSRRRQLFRLWKSMRSDLMPQVLEYQKNYRLQ